MKELLLNLNYTGIILMLFGFFTGIKFPDIDLKIKFINHRSIITHSPFLAIVLYVIAKKLGTSDFTYFVSAFALSEGVHLIYDFFPKQWLGTALIKVPVKGGFGIKTSKYFILISILILIFIGINLMETLPQLKLSFFLAIVTFFIFYKKEGKFIRPLLMFTLIYFSIGYILFPFLFFEVKNFIIEKFEIIEIFFAKH